MSLLPDLVVAVGALCAGFTTGLTGFGTGLVALGFWLHVIGPQLAAPLVVICSVAGQCQSLIAVRRAFDLRRLLPFLAGGLAGVPLGVAALGWIEAGSFRLAVGLFLLAYSGAMLASRRLPVITWGGRAADAAIGLGGGVLGGAAGLSGPLPTIWCSLKGWSKDGQRAVFQPFNLAVLTWALVAQAWDGVLTAEVGRLTLVSLPGVLIGAWIGARTYGRIDDRRFRLLVLWLLFGAGLALTLPRLI